MAFSERMVGATRGIVFQDSVLDPALTVRGSLHGLRGTKLKSAVESAVRNTGAVGADVAPPEALSSFP